MKILLAIVLALPSYGQILAPILFGASSGGGGGATITRVNSTSTDNAASATTIASGALSTTTGNLIAVLWSAGGTINATGVTDTAGNTYAQCTSSYVYAGGVATTDIWYAKNITGNAANVVTVTFTGSVAFRSIHQVQIAGASTTAPMETGGNGTAVAATVTTSSFSPAGAMNYNIAIGTQAVSSSNLWNAGANYSLVANSGAGVNSEFEERTSVPSGAQTASIGFTSSSTMTISACSFKP